MEYFFPDLSFNTTILIRSIEYEIINICLLNLVLPSGVQKLQVRNCLLKYKNLKTIGHLIGTGT